MKLFFFQGCKSIGQDATLKACGVTRACVTGAIGGGVGDGWQWQSLCSSPASHKSTAGPRVLYQPHPCQPHHPGMRLFMHFTILIGILCFLILSLLILKDNSCYCFFFLIYLFLELCCYLKMIYMKGYPI